MNESLEKNIYAIDCDDRLVYVGGDWNQSASSSDAPELTGRKVIDVSLWSFLSSDLMRHIYRQMIAEVRTGKSLMFDFRCDTPDARRLVEMRMTPTSNGGVQFESIVKQGEGRPTQEILRKAPKTSSKILISCSWCKKIKTGRNDWHEVEQAVDILRLFELDPPPQLSHGICLPCFDSVLTQFDEK